ncbi:unnamed protein product [Rotaria sp. Silwood2]|nr:unnamed protein product [Rotaria sp. Silwood2]
MITSIWAVGFLLEFLARLFLILIHLPINKIVLYAHIILSSITVLCIISTIICIVIERRKTLLLIERWNIQGKEKKLSEISTLFATVKYHSNPVLYIDT